jgi:hypothetical protein
MPRTCMEKIIFASITIQRGEIGQPHLEIDNTKHMTMSQFQTRLIKIWNEMPQQLVCAACISFA